MYCVVVKTASSGTKRLDREDEGVLRRTQQGDPKVQDTGSVE